MDMDRLIVLDRGSLVADGTHADLLRLGGLYAELWRRQSGDFNPGRARLSCNRRLECTSMTLLSGSSSMRADGLEQIPQAVVEHGEHQR